jgi:hypothetical protein
MQTKGSLEEVGQTAHAYALDAMTSLTNGNWNRESSKVADGHSYGRSLIGTKQGNERETMLTFINLFCSDKSLRKIDPSHFLLGNTKSIQLSTRHRAKGLTGTSRSLSSSSRHPVVYQRHT